MQIQPYDRKCLKVNIDSNFVTFVPCKVIFNIKSFTVLNDVKFFNSSKEYT